MFKRPAYQALEEFRIEVNRAAKRLHLELMVDDGLFLLLHRDIDAFYCSFRPIKDRTE